MSVKLGAQLGELLALIKAYVAQETLEPARSIGRLVLFALFSGALLGIGLLLLAVALLRYLADLDVFAGKAMSTLPYLAACLFCGLCVFGLVRAARRG